MTLRRKEYKDWALYSNPNNCSYLIPIEDIVRNNEYLSNISFPPIGIPNNLTRDMINAGAETYFFLNSCYKTLWIGYYYNVFGGGKSSSVTYSESGIILNLLNIITTSTEDGRQIGRKVFKELKSMIALKNFDSFDFKEKLHKARLSSIIQSKIKNTI